MIQQVAEIVNGKLAVRVRPRLIHRGCSCVDWTAARLPHPPFVPADF